jgi:choline dehydrogenase
MKPRSKGRVSLNGPAPETPVRIEHGFLTDAHDRNALLEVAEMMRRLGSGLDRYLGPELRPGPDVELETWVDTEARGFFHPVGTCGIGRVVEPDGKVIGLDGLYVCDASVMPTIPRANTHISTIAVAERIAELL